MNNKLCPLKVELTNDRYYCIGEHCAWWQKGKLFLEDVTTGRCAIVSLANIINCEVKIHE